MRCPSRPDVRTLSKVVILLAACGCSGASPSPSPSAAPFSFVVQDIDGPPAQIAVNGKVVGTLTCVVGAIELTTEQPDMPDLSWVVVATARDGTELGRWTADGTTSYHLFLRRYGPMLESGPQINPGPGPMLPCPSVIFDTPSP